MLDVDSHLAGLYLLSKMESSVKMPIWARFKLVIAEWGRLNDNLLQEFNQFNRKIGLKKNFDGHRHVIRISAFRKGCGDNLDTS